MNVAHKPNKSDKYSLSYVCVATSMSWADVVKCCNGMH